MLIGRCGCFFGGLINQIYGPMHAISQINLCVIWADKYQRKKNNQSNKKCHSNFPRIYLIQFILFEKEYAISVFVYTILCRYIYTYVMYAMHVSFRFSITFHLLLMFWGGLIFFNLFLYRLLSF